MKPDFKSLIEKPRTFIDMELRGNTLLSLDSGEKVSVALQDPQVLFKHLVEQQQSLRLVGQLEGQQAENLNALSLNNLAQFLSDEPEDTQDTTSLTFITQPRSSRKVSGIHSKRSSNKTPTTRHRCSLSRTGFFNLV